MSAATWLDPVIRPTATLSALDYMAGDGTDESDGMRALFAARAAIAGDVAIYFPEPSVKYHVASTTDNPFVVSVPSGTLIYGEGAASLIYWTGATKAGGQGGGQEIFRLAGASRVLIRDLGITGDNDPFVAYSQAQSVAISLRKNGATVCTDVTVRDVTFRNLVGFPTASPANIPKRCYVLRCPTFDCANGHNINADYGIYYRCALDNTEGIEYAGFPGVVALNDIAGGRISVGGRIVEDFEASGVIVVGNSISEPPGLVALQTSESFVDGWVGGNVVEGVTTDQQAAMQIGVPQVTGDYLYDRATVVDNYTHGSYKGFVLQAGDGHLVADNHFGGTNLSGATTSYSTGQRVPKIIDNTFENRFVVGASPDGTAIEILDNTFTTAGFVKSVGALDPVTIERPAGVEAKLFGDVTEGFATLQIRNWSDAAVVEIDLSDSGLEVGDRWHLLHPYDLFGGPYASGTYLGAPVKLVMREVAPPSDWTVSTTEPLPTLGPRFNAFVLRKVGDKDDPQPLGPYTALRISALRAQARLA